MAIEYIFLLALVLEGFFICLKQDERNDLLKKEMQEDEKDVCVSRRKTNGVFRNPLGDGYRKNSKGLYEPIKPNRMGDDEDDDV